MSGEKKPSFRIQKPVLLSPMPKSPGHETHKHGSRRDSRSDIDYIPARRYPIRCYPDRCVQIGVLIKDVVH